MKLASVEKTASSYELIKDQFCRPDILPNIWEMAGRMWIYDFHGPDYICDPEGINYVWDKCVYPRPGISGTKFEVDFSSQYIAGIDPFDSGWFTNTHVILSKIINRDPIKVEVVKVYKWSWWKRWLSRWFSFKLMVVRRIDEGLR